MTDEYKTLRRVLDAAYDQAANGKGKERHANDKPFDEQPIMRITEMLQGAAGPLFQAMKKIQEANSMSLRGESEKAIHELRGAIVYTAAAIAFLEWKDEPEVETEGSKLSELANIDDLSYKSALETFEPPKADKQIVPIVGNYYRRIGDPIRENVVQVVGFETADEVYAEVITKVKVESVRFPEKVKHDPIELPFFNANYEFVDRYDRLD